MKFLLPHKVWLATLVLAVALIFGSAPLLGFLRKEAAAKLAELHDEQAKMQQTLDQLDDDITATRRLSGEIGEDEIEKSLAGVDRLRAADVLEKRAAAARLFHFTYTVSPERKWTMRDSALGTQDLALSTISVKADAPLDTDIYRFISSLPGRLPGRLRLQSLTLERNGDAPPLAAANLRMAADFEWISNGAVKEIAQGK